MSGQSEEKQGIASLQEGQRVDLTCLLANKQILKTKAGKPFGSLTISDATGSAQAKLWERAEDLLQSLEPGAPVSARGRVQVYNGRIQVVLDGIEAAPHADPADFLPKSPFEPSALWERVNKAKRAVEDPRLKRVLKAFFGDKAFCGKFEKAPAAKGAHHAYVHGLLEHTASVAGLALLVAGHYGNIDKDMLITGALLHDVGKTEELSLGPPIDYTDQGRLEGHVVLGVRMLDERLAGFKDMPRSLASHLRHLILSHHGFYEFGSPKKPKTPEAMILHLIDDLDAKTAMIQEVMDSPRDGGGNWSRFNRLLERFIYVGPPPLEARADKPRRSEKESGPNNDLPQSGLFD